MIERATFDRWLQILGDRFGRMFQADTIAEMYRLASRTMSTAQFVAGAELCLMRSQFFPTIEEIRDGGKPDPVRATLAAERQRREELAADARIAQYELERRRAMEAWCVAHPDDRLRIEQDARASAGWWLEPPLSMLAPWNRMALQAEIDRRVTELLEFPDFDTWCRKAAA